MKKQLSTCLVRFINFIISLLNKEIEIGELYENQGGNIYMISDEKEKLIDTLNLKDILILSDTGYQSASHIHLTKAFKEFNVLTQSGRILRCADEHILFDADFNEIYAKDLIPYQTYIQTKTGLDLVLSVTENDIYKRMFDVTVDSIDHRYYTDDILSHNTTTTTIFLAWFLCFHFEKNCFFLANKNDTVIEIVDKTQKVVKYLPFFLKPGVLNKTQRSIVFDNGSRLKSQATTKKSSIGDTIHLLYVDEFAHIDANIQKDFWENVYPTLSSSKISRIILTSTANGLELFHDIFKSARMVDKETHKPYEKKLDNHNSFAKMRIDYWQVPGRDEAWKQKEIQSFGGGEVGERAFNQQYGNQFLDGATVLLEAETLKRLEALKQGYKFKIIDVFEEYNEKLDDIDKIKYNQLIWKTDFDPNDIEDTDRFMFSIDISEGEEGDYSVLNIFRLRLKDKYKNMKIDPDVHNLYNFFVLKQVGVMRSNFIDTTKFAQLIYSCLFMVFNPEHVKIVMEWNTYGSEMYLKMSMISGDNNLLDDSYFVKFAHKNDSTVMKIGIKSRTGYKNIICDNLKLIMQNESIEVNEEMSVDELSRFGKNKNGTYSGQLGNDDISITIVYIGAAMDTVEYFELVEDYFDLLSEEIQNELNILLNQDEKESLDDMYDLFGETNINEGLKIRQDDDDDWI